MGFLYWPSSISYIFVKIRSSKFDDESKEFDEQK
jgi:hypothetical protein